MTKTDELIDAIRRNDAAKVGVLLDEEPALLGAKSGVTTAILMTAYVGHPELAQLFTSRGASLSFFEACALGDGEGVRRMLEADPALLGTFSEDGYPPVGLAIFFKHPAVARELIERGADVNAAARNPQRVAPVHAAATVCDRETMRLLLERGANPDARQAEGVAAIHSSASHGDIEMARLLIDHGADAHARTDAGQDAGAIAEKYNQPAFVEWFRNNV